MPKQQKAKDIIQMLQEQQQEQALQAQRATAAGHPNVARDYLWASLLLTEIIREAERSIRD